MDWWKEFAYGDGKPVGSRGEYSHRGKTYQYYKRADGQWHIDQRRDEDARHKFSLSLVCARCSQTLLELTENHLKGCPYSHEGEGPLVCKLQLLCEGERRKGVDPTPWMTDLTFNP